MAVDKRLAVLNEVDGFGRSYLRSPMKEGPKSIFATFWEKPCKSVALLHTLFSSNVVSF